MADLKKITTGMANGPEAIDENLEAINAELSSGGNVVHKTGDESIAGKKTFTGEVEVKGSFLLPTKSWDGEIGNGITLSLRKKGTTVEYLIGGEITSSISGGANFSKNSIPTEFRPRIRYPLIGHLAGTLNSFNIDVPASGVCQWFGPTMSSGTPRGSGTYPTD